MSRFIPSIASLIIGSLIAFWASYAWGQTTQPTTRPTIKYFFVYSQPVDDFDKWNALGFNGYFLSETKNNTVDRRKSREKAKSLGWMYFDAYIDDNDVNDPNLLGWVPNNSDEWNRRKPNLTPIIDQIGYLQELKSRTASNKLIMVNGDGMAITTAMWEKVPYNGVKNSERSIYSLVGGWSQDWYPVVNISSDTPDQIARRPMYLPAQAQWVLHQRWAPQWSAKPELRFCILEANKGYKSPLGVTPAQIREQAEYVLGVRPFPVPNEKAQPVLFQGQLTDGIVYWFQNGQDGPGWRWDTSSAEVKAEVAAVIRDYKAQQSVPSESPELAEARRRILELDTQLKASEAQKTAILKASEEYITVIRAATQPTK